MEKELLMIARGIKKSNHQWETPRGEKELGQTYNLNRIRFCPPRQSKRSYAPRKQEE